MYANLPLFSIHRRIVSDLLSKTEEEVSAIHQAQLVTSEEVAKILSVVVNMECTFQDLGTLYHGVHSELTEIHKVQLNDERQKLLDWLGWSGDPSTNHNNAVKKREPETGAWFLESNEFYTWMRSHGFLWLHGIPGCGKTILCSTIIEAVKEVCFESATHKLAYFYFDFQNTEKQNMDITIRSLLRQLCAGEMQLPQEVQIMYDRYKGSGLRPTVEELNLALLSLIDYLGKEIYIIMDALDEFPEKSQDSNRQELLDQIKHMVEHPSQQLHILVTSRNEPDIRTTLSDLAGKGISIQSSKVDADIRLFVRTCLEKDPFHRLPVSVKKSIEARLGEGACGMFRWVVCQFDALKDCRKVNAIKKALTELPKDLDETYSRILANIPEDHIEDARSILKWLAVSERPLSLQEVAEAAVLRPGDDPIDPDERFYNASDVLRICCGLVSLSKEMICICDYWLNCDVVRFAHFSVQEYLMSDRAESFSVSTKFADNYVGESCVSYLLHMDRPSLSGQCLDENPLLEYAAEHWFMHVRRIESDKGAVLSLLDRTYRLFSEDFALSFLNWLRVCDPVKLFEKSDLQKGRKDIKAPLEYASFLGLQDTTQRLLEAGAKVNGKGNESSSALSTTSETGHYEIVKWLLDDYGANIGCGALSLASKRGHIQIVQLLLDRGADVNESSPGWYCNPLQEALAHHHNLIALLLLEHGADVNAQGSSHSSTLVMASKNGNAQIVEQLLQKGADINAPGSAENGTALQQAAAEGHDKIVQLLLEAGAEVNAPGCEMWCNPLQGAARSGSSQIFERLLAAGVDFNAKGGWSGTALQEAAKHGSYELVKRLLELGVDINLHGHGKYDPGTALKAASTGGYVHVVQLLLSYGADANIQGGKGHNAYHGTPLQAASANGIHQIVDLLLNSGADVNTPGRAYGTALQAASAIGHNQIVQLLLGRGADINAQGGKEQENRSDDLEIEAFTDFGNALQAASANGHYQTVQLLIGAGADVNAQNKNFGTALTAASEYGRNWIVQLLLKHGAEINAQIGTEFSKFEDALHHRGSYQRSYPNALQAASAMGNYQTVQLLLDSGAEINTQHNGQNSALQAAQEKQESVVQLLLERGPRIL